MDEDGADDKDDESQDETETGTGTATATATETESPQKDQMMAGAPDVPTAAGPRSGSSLQHVSQSPSVQVVQMQESN